MVMVTTVCVGSGCLLSSPSSLPSSGMSNFN